MTEFEDMVIDILESVGDNPDSDLTESADKIHALADYARKTPIYKVNIHKGEDFFKNLTPVEIYNHMIIKIVESPTKFHRDAAVILTVPHLSDALKAEEKIEEVNKLTCSLKPSYGFSTIENKKIKPYKKQEE